MADLRPEERESSAMEELARDPSSRKRFLKAMGGAGAATAFGVFLAACGDDDDENKSSSSQQDQGKSSGQDDLAIVNYALTLEYLEADFYKKVEASGLFKGAQLDLIKGFGKTEQEHVEALEATAKMLGTPAEKPKTTFPLDSAKSVIELAATVENVGAAAYLGQANRIRSKDVLAAALSIHTVEARHAAVLNDLAGKSFVPDGAFAKPMAMDEVLETVKPFIVS